MTIASFSVPVDIPWQRIAFSRDMMDTVACDRELPLRWRSSVAVFEYQPPADQQRIDGFLISYLKVTCSVTGYQPNGKEIRIRERIGRSGWASKKVADVITETVDAYYPCYGAMLEVVVAPSDPNGIRFEDYPYFVDFDPKKRELYEAVTDTGEVMSRSLDDVNVRLGQTTLQSHEVKDKTSVGVAAAGGGVGASAGSESSTTDLNERKTENVRTTDAARENRETLSHTTQLSQMYHQLNSYHVGTNRAAFFVLPRPHSVQSPNTFVNGPREIEGIQEFMLIVARPADQERFCVEAYLETAHLVRTPNMDMDLKSDTLVLPRLATDDGDGVLTGFHNGFEIRKKASVPFPAPAGFEIDKARNGQGYKIETINQTGDVKIDWDVQPDHVTVNVEIVGRIFFAGTSVRKDHASVELTATIHLKKKTGTVTSYSDTLLITGRAVCSCDPNILLALPIDDRQSIVFEKTLTHAESVGGRERQPLSIRDANRFSAGIRHEMVRSISSADRYPRDKVSLLDTQLIAGAIAAGLQSADETLNPRLARWSGHGEELARRVTKYAPLMTRSELLQISLPEQVERFGLSFEESAALRRALVNLPTSEGAPPMPKYTPIVVPRLSGLPLDDASAVLRSLHLVISSVTEADDPLPMGVVVTQHPAAGESVDAGAEVEITLSSGLSVLLPDVLGLGLMEAMCRLLGAGVRSDPSIEGRPGPDARVAELKPPAGTLITPHAPITLRLREPHEGRPSSN